MNEKKQFTIKVDGKVFTSDESGFLNLNDITKAFNLKPPSQWRTKERRRLEQDAKLHSVTVPNGIGLGSTNVMVADEDATIFFAMWISYEFGLKVVQAFRSLRHGNLEQAVELAGSTMSDKDNYYLQKLMQMKGLCFTKSCWYANIPHPNKLINVLHKLNKWKYTDINNLGKIYATKEGIDSGYFYNCYGDPESSKVVMRITKSGREMFRKHYQYFNSLVEKYN